MAGTAETLAVMPLDAPAAAVVVPLAPDGGIHSILAVSRSLFVGSSKRNDMRITCDGVESCHCAVYATAAGANNSRVTIEVEDLSESGTFRNGTRLRPRLVRHRLEHGDVLSLGSASPIPEASFSIQLSAVGSVAHTLPEGPVMVADETTAPSFLRFILVGDVPKGTTVLLSAEEAGIEARGYELMRTCPGSSRYCSLAVPVRLPCGAKMRYYFEATACDAPVLEHLSIFRTVSVPQPGHVVEVADNVSIGSLGVERKNATGVPMKVYCDSELESWINDPSARVVGAQRCFQFCHDGLVMPYFLYVPPCTPPDATAWPLLLFLHGDHGRTVDDCDSPGVGRSAMDYGPPKLFANPEQYPLVAGSFVGLAPQCPADHYWFKEGNWYSNRWSVKMEAALVALIAQVELIVPVDHQRRYLTGCSMGGYGAWEFALVLPDAFAAVVPVSAHFDERRHDDLARAVACLPLRVYHSVDDNVCLPHNTALLQQALERAGADRAEMRWVEMPPGREHDADVSAYEADDDLFRWLLVQRRHDAVRCLVAEVGIKDSKTSALTPGEVIETMSRYYVCGSWNGWSLELMEPKTDGTYICVASVDTQRRAVFQIIKDGDWNQRYCPRVLPPGAMASGHGADRCVVDGTERMAVPGAVDGPGPGGHGCNWLIDATAGRGAVGLLRGMNARFSLQFHPGSRNGGAPSLRWSPHLNKRERSAVRRLAQLASEFGAGTIWALDAYTCAGRDEELAGALLFERLDAELRSE